jgi:hypothetical protein
LPASFLQKFLELFNREPSVPDYAAHGEFIHWIVAGNGYDSNAVGHHNVLASAYNAETRLFKGTHSTKMIDSGKLRHN